MLVKATVKVPEKKAVGFAMPWLGKICSTV